MRILIALIMMSLSVVGVAAQDEWPIIENCMGDLTYPIVPKGNWDFPGVIVSSAHSQGVRGARADQNVDYFIALEADDSFPAAGTVSPDGRYFAFPTGETDFAVNSGGDDILSVNHVNIVRTDGLTDESYRFEGSGYVYTGSLRSIKLQPPKWFGSEWVYYLNVGVADTLLTNFKTKETKVWTASLSPEALSLISPDGTRAFTGMPDFIEAEPGILYDIENDTEIAFDRPEAVAWFADSSAFVADTESGLAIVDRDGNVVETIGPGGGWHLALAPNGKAVAFWGSDLHIVDLDAKVIYDLCFQGDVETQYGDYRFYYPNLAWSPDSRSLTFSYDNYLVILDTQTFENQVIDTFSRQVLAWVPLEGETFTTSEGAIRPPLPSATPAPTVTLGPTTTPSPTIAPPTGTPEVSSCQLEVINGANLRADAGANFDKVGSAAVGFILTADSVKFNEAEYFRWWRLTTGEWIREDFTSESAECEFLPDVGGEE